VISLALRRKDKSIHRDKCMHVFHRPRFDSSITTTLRYRKVFSAGILLKYYENH
jgi:hypothetical protein